MPRCYICKTKQDENEPKTKSCNIILKGKLQMLLSSCSVNRRFFTSFCVRVPEHKINSSNVQMIDHGGCLNRLFKDLTKQYYKIVL